MAISNWLTLAIMRHRKLRQAHLETTKYRSSKDLGQTTEVLLASMGLIGVMSWVLTLSFLERLGTASAESPEARSERAKETKSIVKFFKPHLNSVVRDEDCTSNWSRPSQNSYGTRWKATPLHRGKAKLVPEADEAAVWRCRHRVMTSRKSWEAWKAACAFGSRAARLQCNNRQEMKQKKLSSSHHGSQQTWSQNRTGSSSMNSNQVLYGENTKTWAILRTYMHLDPANIRKSCLMSRMMYFRSLAVHLHKTQHTQ